MIDISPADEAIVNEILKKYVPKCEVRVFGSRHNWTAKSYADLDLAIVDDAKLDKKVLYALQEAFEESELSFRVDVLDWHAISDEFMAIIDQGYSVIQEVENKLPDGWVAKKLGDVITLQRGHDLPKTKMLVGVYPVAGSNGIIGYHNSFTTKGKGVTIGRSGNIGKPQYYEQKFWAHNTVLYVKDFKGNDEKFIYYFLKTMDFSILNSGSAVPTLNRNYVHDTLAKIPAKEIQKEIAAILSSLDDKIELKQQINKKLEEMAQAIFKEWFIDFNFPDENGNPYRDSGGVMIDSELGQIPAPWSVGKLGDYVKIKSGFAFKSSWWVDSGVSVVKIKDIANYTIDFSNLSFVDKTYSHLASEFRLSKGDLVIAMTGATIGKFGIIPKTEKVIFANQRVGKFFLGNNPLQKLGFLYCNLLQENVIYQINAYANGAAQPNISPSAIESISVNMPNNIEIIDKFNDAVKPMFKSICESIFEINQLKQVRDTLLPKLMSGEIKI